MANALSKYYTGIVNCVTTPVILTNTFTGKEIKTEGIWDTGATDSVITKSMAQELGLAPVSKTVVRGVHGECNANVYYVKITLNNDNITLDTLVTESDELRADKSVGMLIGMNIIKMGDFCITNNNGCTVMSFICPSQKKIDFVEDINEYNRLLKMHEAWLRHGNNRCPCNSGKIWNNCHGKIRYK